MYAKTAVNGMLSVICGVSFIYPQAKVMRTDKPLHSVRRGGYMSSDIATLTAKHLKHIRKENRVTMRMLVERTGITFTELGRYEQGEPMSAETAFSIACALDTTIYHQLCGLGDTP
jgi:hypothetical protein